ncbi:MAG: tol-pal system protein YbgF [Pseudomonadaceae bacterium]|nr:tol-pal system protein YbgF [Pseudomonadaceae bacterium]
MKAIQHLAKVRENVGALAPRFLFTLALLASPYLVTQPALANARAAAVANAELLMQIEQMQQEIKSLRNMVEKQENSLSKMQTEQRNRYLDLDQRAQEYAKRLLALEERPISAAPSASPQAVKAAAEPASPSAATLAPASLEKDRDAYNKAYAHVPEQRFEEAINSFQAFIRQYPNSRLIGNAYYWLGEIYMAQNRTADAEKMFNAVITNHPDSFKIADSKYKLGLIYARYGNNSKAQEMMEAIIAEHPREPAAELARSYLKK